ncbi:hypothetical protein MINTM011_20470 [Mycobacterium paraintracellulare]|nr:hypothetical protein MINTM011_20470 [Mycobacterium paraintracellulare]
MEIDLVYVKDKGPVAHIWDYLKDRTDHALCGHGYQDPLVIEERGRPRAVCRACQALSPRAEVVQWREIAEELQTWPDDYEALRIEYENLWAEYEDLWNTYQKLWTHSENQRREIRNLRAKDGRPAKKPSQKRPPRPPKQQKFSSGVRASSRESPRKRPRVRLYG